MQKKGEGLHKDEKPIVVRSLKRIKQEEILKSEGKKKDYPFATFGSVKGVCEYKNIFTFELSVNLIFNLPTYKN